MVRPKTGKAKSSTARSTSYRAVLRESGLVPLGDLWLSPENVAKLDEIKRLQGFTNRGQAVDFLIRSWEQKGEKVA
jgi:hypothetical protein